MFFQGGLLCSGTVDYFRPELLDYFHRNSHQGQVKGAASIIKHTERLLIKEVKYLQLRMRLIKNIILTIS